jgi:hypothetical protein
MMINYYQARKEGIALIRKTELDNEFLFDAYQGRIYFVTPPDPFSGDEAFFKTWVYDNIAYPKEVLIWFVHYGYWPSTIWFIDGDETNRKISNLMCDERIHEFELLTGFRFLEPFETNDVPIEKKPRKVNRKAPLGGILWDKDKAIWRVNVKVGTTTKSCGSYVELWDAICARMSAINTYGANLRKPAKKPLKFIGRPPKDRKLIAERKRLVKEHK